MRGAMRNKLISIQTRLLIYLKEKLYHKNNKNFKNYLSIVAICKNEAPYIAEWIEYHKIVGVEKFYIYNNESTDNLKEVLTPYIKDGTVELIDFPGKTQQVPAYKDAIKKHSYNTRWLAIIDLDEFIVPISTKTIPEFLKDFEDCSSVEINWLIYGSSEYKTRTDGLVMERFKDHSLPDFETNKHVKSIVNPRDVYSTYVHTCKCIGKIVDTHKNVVSTNNDVVDFFKREAFHDKIRINHYFSKSYEEFLQKRNRGMADNFDIRSEEEFYQNDNNDVKNDTIMDKYIEEIKKKLS
jgi:hypothetical protein